MLLTLLGAFIASGADWGMTPIRAEILETASRRDDSVTLRLLLAPDAGADIDEILTDPTHPMTHERPELGRDIRVVQHRGATLAPPHPPRLSTMRTWGIFSVLARMRTIDASITAAVRLAQLQKAT